MRCAALPGGGEGNPDTEAAATTARRVTPSSSSERKLYSEAVGGVKKKKRFQLTVKTTLNQPPETIKGILRSKVNPSEIKMGINTFKLLRKGSVLIETNSKEEIEKLENEINSKYEGGFGSKHPQTEEDETSDLQYPREYIRTKLRTH